MGKQKLLLDVGGAPMLERVLAIFRSSKVKRIVVVLGEDEQAVRGAVRFGSERIVVNADPSEGMSSSLRAGIRAVSGEADAAMIALADQPFVMPETIDRMIESHVRNGAVIVAPFYGGRRGNPVLFARSMFPSLMRTKGDEGAKSLIEANHAKVLRVDVDDAGTVADVDTREDYERLVLGAGRSGRV